MPTYPFDIDVFLAQPLVARVDRGRRKLERYLGRDESAWDEKFRRYLHADLGTVWLHLIPRTLRATDLSYRAVTAYR